MLYLRRPKKRLSQRVGENVLQEQMQISNDTYVIAAGSVYGDDRLHAQLVFIRDVEQPGINRAGRPLTFVEIARLGLKAELCD
jgi:hypothetical protein